MGEYIGRWGTSFPFQGTFLLVCYLVLSAVILRSAWINRQQGWAIGLLFGFMLLSLPLWVMGLFYFSQWLGLF